MGKAEKEAGGDLWDDTALVDAFAQAMSKYKEMHGVANSVGAPNEESNSDDGSNTSKVPPPAGKTDGNKELEVQESQHGPMRESLTHHSNNETRNKDLEIQENQHGQESSTSEILAEVPLKNKRVVGSSDANGMERSQLLKQYYELEEKRQKVLEQLRQSDYWNHQSQAQGSSTEAYQGVGFDSSYYGYYDPYAQRNGHWSTSHAQQEPIDVGTYPAYCISMTPVSGSNLMPQANYFNDAVPQISGSEAERTTSSTNLKAAAISNSEEKERGKPETVSRCESSELQNLGRDRDLSLVINSWYSAGYYTGRYVTLQSLKKGHS